MPKYIVKEGILDKFLAKLFSNVAKGKGNKVAKLLDKDPELQALTKKAIDNRNKMQKHIAKKRKNDAAYDYFYKALK